MPLHILHVYKDYYPVIGGIENHVRALAEAQVGRGHEVSVLVTNPGGQPGRALLNGVKIRRVRRLATMASTPISPTFPLALRRLRPTITHLQFPYPVGELSQLLGGRRPYVITYHSDIVRQKAMLRLYRPFLQRVLAGAARIIATSPQYLASSPFLQPWSSKCSVVPLGISPAELLDIERAPFAGPVPRLLFVGRQRYYKGLDGLLRALTMAPGALRVVGDGPMRPAWERLAEELGLGERVIFLGEVGDEELRACYASADAFVLPANARAEAYGLVLLEAMAAGLPCITTELGTGTSFIVQDNVTGLVIPPNDPPALAAAIRRLANDPAGARAMGAAGRQRFRQHFTLDKMVEGIERVYAAALEASQAVRLPDHF
jgi:rhamnosyl/mannosyltransferase